MFSFASKFLHFYLSIYWVTDPYLNTDAGTMSPFEHGEVFVLDDGGEVCFFIFPLFIRLNFIHMYTRGWPVLWGWVGRLVCVIGVHAIGIFVHKVRNGLLVIVNLDFYGCRWYKFSLMI